MTSSAPGTRVTGYQAIRYGPGQSAPTSKTATPVTVAAASPLALPGDFILTHSSGIYGRLIRLGETIRYWGADKIFAHWSHAAIFINEAGDIVETLGGDVQQRNISVYHGTEYVVVHLPATTTPLDRDQAIEFAEFSLNDPYGWLTIVSVALCLLTGAKFSFGLMGSKFALLWLLVASSASAKSSPKPSRGT